MLFHLMIYYEYAVASVFYIDYYLTVTSYFGCVYQPNQPSFCLQELAPIASSLIIIVSRCNYPISNSLTYPFILDLPIRILVISNIVNHVIHQLPQSIDIHFLSYWTLEQLIILFWRSNVSKSICLQLLPHSLLIFHWNMSIRLK